MALLAMANIILKLHESTVNFRIACILFDRSLDQMKFHSKKWRKQKEKNVKTKGNYDQKILEQLYYPLYLLIDLFSFLLYFRVLNIGHPFFIES